MKYKYIFFDWGYTLINKFKNVDNENNSILVKYNLKWDDILDKETKDTIIKLYEQGYYLGIISNNSIRNVEYILEREGIKKYFNKIVISEEIKERKPNLKVYMKAFEDISKDEYNNIVFFSDELLEDLLGVKILGVKTVWYEQKIDNK